MRVLFVTHFYPPEELSMAHLVHELAQGMAGRGHEVHVLTGYPNWPSGRWLAGHQPRWFGTGREDGVTVHRFRALPSPNGSLLERLLDFKSFELGIRHHGRKVPRPDAIYVHVPPNEDACAAVALGARFQCASIVNVQDIHPDSAIALGYVRNPAAIWLLRRQQRGLLAEATHVTTIGAGMKRRLVSHGVPPWKVEVIPNWIDTGALVPMDRVNALRSEWQIPAGKFVVLYAGTLGRVHDTRVIVEVAERLRHVEDVLFLMVGQGHDFEANRQLASQRALGNVQLRPLVPRSRLSEMQALADVSLVTLRAGFGETSVPSKVLGYMSAGRGVVAAVDSDCDTAELVRTARCGVVLPPGDAGALAKSLEGLAGERAKCAEWGRAAREHAVRFLDREVVVAQACAFLEGFAGGSGEVGCRGERRG